MPTREVAVPGDPSQPLSYTLPGSVAFVVRAAFCTFNGTGASGNFIPSMQWYSQSGDFIGQYIAPEVAAGSTADVSFFPGVKSATSGAGAPVAMAQGWFDSLNYTDPQLSIPTATVVDIGWPHTFITDQTYFAFTTTSNTNDTLELQRTDAIYMIACSLRMAGSGYAIQFTAPFGQFGVNGEELKGVLAGYAQDGSNVFSVGALTGLITANNWQWVLPSSAPALGTVQISTDSGSTQKANFGRIIALAFTPTF